MRSLIKGADLYHLQENVQFKSFQTQAIISTVQKLIAIVHRTFPQGLNWNARILITIDRFLFFIC